MFGVLTTTAVGGPRLFTENSCLYGKPDFFPLFDLQHDECGLLKIACHRECHPSDAHDLPVQFPHVGSVDARGTASPNPHFLWENPKNPNFWPVIDL